MRTAERHGQTLEWFYNLQREQQEVYLAYNAIRMTEDAEQLAAMAKFRGI